MAEFEGTWRGSPPRPERRTAGEGLKKSVDQTTSTGER